MIDPSGTEQLGNFRAGSNAIRSQVTWILLELNKNEKSSK
jgi:hypothetical protein